MDSTEHNQDLICDEHLKAFEELGFFVLDNFLPQEVANMLLEKFESYKCWNQVEQTREHYKKGGPFHCDSPLLPDESELYYNRTERTALLDKDPQWADIFKEYFVNRFESAFKCKITEPYILLQKYGKGSFSRIHTDDYRGEVRHVDIGFIYYLNRRWVWDWGGLLIICPDNKCEDMAAVVPKHNRISIVNHQKRPPHAVTPVTDWAKEVRYGLTGFIGCDQRLYKG